MQLYSTKNIVARSQRFYLLRTFGMRSNRTAPLSYTLFYASPTVSGLQGVDPHELEHSRDATLCISKPAQTFFGLVQAQTSEKDRKVP